MPLPEHFDSMDSGLPVSSPVMSNEPYLQFNPELSYASHKRRRSSDSEMPGSSLPQPAPTYPPSQSGPFGSLHHVSGGYDPPSDPGPSFESYRHPGPSEAGPSEILPQQIPSDPFSYPGPDDTDPFFSSITGDRPPPDPAVRARKLLALAHATRDSLLAVEQTALRRIKEFQVLYEITVDELEEIRVKKRDAILQVISVQRSLEARGIPVPPESEPYRPQSNTRGSAMAQDTGSGTGARAMTPSFHYSSGPSESSQMSS